MTGNLSGFETELKGGLFSSIRRSFLSEPTFFQHYTNQTNQVQTLRLQKRREGNLVSLDFHKAPSWVLQKGSYFASTLDVMMKMKFMGLKMGLFSSLGWTRTVLHSNSSSNIAFLSVDGSAIVKHVNEGETLNVTGDNVVAYDEKMRVNLKMVPGFLNRSFGFQRCFITSFTGPGTVVLQSYTRSKWLNTLDQSLNQEINLNSFSGDAQITSRH
ncbi:tryptophan RNA-binding attenuator protein-like protein [Anaeramoeba flamelloides]|uniref:Tryptophan RNA-binding attenuator protein-like protein n=1 Tax=Anaeramoeba flamelloides TaxID=1746091 RepID=A0AAV8A0N6_9EUKA|nr:tryptophan RNA-binding attenuator protein-like protein [Anaeramoeba flamelloides]|eukprot:Anaeramoba_flamelloidesc28110_g1_i1.p1 GENE.c28110_g1_i1~~c28110_g1_i1.p1  ORF type:complete len:214 (-),score=36.79 c28110_g1_i1:71-712(-)